MGSRNAGKSIFPLFPLFFFLSFSFRFLLFSKFPPFLFSSFSSYSFLHFLLFLRALKWAIANGARHATSGGRNLGRRTSGHNLVLVQDHHPVPTGLKSVAPFQCLAIHEATGSGTLAELSPQGNEKKYPQVPAENVPGFFCPGRSSL